MQCVTLHTKDPLPGFNLVGILAVVLPAAGLHDPHTSLHQPMGIDPGGSRQ